VFGLFTVYEKAQGDPPRTLRGKSPMVALLFSLFSHGEYSNKVIRWRQRPMPYDL
jgi:hypothetical protein